MNINISERCQKVWQCLCEKTKKSIREIADSTGIPKSSVHRHKKAIERRQQHGESYLWETKEGGQWLRLLVFGVIYCFGIKGGIGADSLSAFFHLLRLEERIGCSASALRELEVQIKEKIIAYGAEQAESCQGEQPIGICVGADETFYGLPILVAIELGSGFIFSEAQCENRTYETWWEQVSGWFNREQWDCRALVSDGAKALVKLAISGLGCPSVPDVFHLLYGLSKSMGTAIARQRMQLQKQQNKLQERMAANPSQSNAALTAQSEDLHSQQQTLERDHQDYLQSLHALSQRIHPFNLNTGESQLGLDLPDQLQAPLATLTRLSQTYAQTQSQAALSLWQRQIPHLSRAIHGWWLWVMESLSAQTQDPELQQWVLTSLLPWVYWHQQTQKTRQPQLKQGYQQAAQQAHECFLADGLTQTLSSQQQQQWLDWAIWICSKFQRTSSAVEGRNGYLSALHHANRGFTEQTLTVLTIIHNFDLQRDDGTTAAQRLFRKSFPNLFTSVVHSMGELPRPRRSQKARKSKTLALPTVPA
jgi:hypothetical protein